MDPECAGILFHLVTDNANTSCTYWLGLHFLLLGIWQGNIFALFYYLAITNPTNDRPSTLEDVSLANNVYNTGFLAFL